METRAGVPILVHWSVPALSLFLLGTGVDDIVTAAAAISAYVSMLVLHELGHQIAAERRGCRVLAIELYPLHGFCKYDQPEYPSDDSIIAWGGAIAQIAVAAPLAASVLLIRYTRFEAINAVLAILGFLSPIIALFNLLPIAPLDGHRAWKLLPNLWSKRRQKRSRRPQTAMEAMEEALRKARKRGGA